MKTLDLSRWQEYKAYVSKQNCDISAFNLSLYCAQRTGARKFLFWSWDENIYNNELAIAILKKEYLKVTIEDYTSWLLDKE